MQVQFLEDDKYGLLIFHAENLDGVLELDNGQSNCHDACAGLQDCIDCCSHAPRRTINPNNSHLCMHA